MIRRIGTSRPGQLVHVDVKKLAKIPPGGGWKVHGRSFDGYAKRHPPRAYVYVDSAIDAFSRLAYSEIHANEQCVQAAGFWHRATEFFASYAITVERVLTVNGACYRSFEFRNVLVANAIAHTRSRPYHPQTGGNVERFNRNCARSGPTPVPTNQTRREHERLTSGYISTIIIDTTPPSRARPSVASTTRLGRTTRQRRKKRTRSLCARVGISIPCASPLTPAF